MQNRIQKVSIKTDTINLDQFLKWSQLVSTGGQAKMLIQEGMVLVNGEVETRRGRTLYPGDKVTITGVEEEPVILELVGTGEG